MASKFQARIVDRETITKQIDGIHPNILISVAALQVKIARELATKMSQRAPEGDPQWRKPGRSPGTYQRSFQYGKLSEHRGDKSVRGNMNETKDPNATGVWAEFAWRFIEYGVHGGERRPHIWPTYREQRKAMKRRLARAMRVAITKAIALQKVSPGEGEGL